MKKNEKILEFLQAINFIELNDVDELKNKLDLKAIKSNELISITINILEPLNPNLYFKLLQKIKNKTDSIDFNLLANYVSFDQDDVYEYIMYYVDNNYIENKVVIESILKRKKIIIENNNIYLTYLNQNEEYCLSFLLKNISIFLSSCGFIFDEVLTKLDSNKIELQNFVKQKEEMNISLLKSTINKPKKEVKEYKNHVDYNKSTQKIIELIPEQQTAIIEVEVFKIDIIKTKNNFNIYKIYVTDYSDSIIVKSFIKENSQLKEVVESLSPGMWIKAKINLQIDIYDDNSLSGIVNSISIIEKPQKYIRNDSYTKKRVELITHTKMTPFEGLVNIDEMCKTLKMMDHKFIAITDKGNCQSFPIAYNSCKKHGINLIYGVQLEMIQSLIPIVINPIDANLLDSEYVIFDIETTGLSPYYDRIIEFGAIKYRKGIIVDKIQFFIDPEIDIPENISKITKIYNKDVLNQPKIKESLEKIIDFFGDAILIAHNGIRFDIEFINQKLMQNNMPIVTNALIDTMQLSRSINLNFPGHSLGAICRKYKIEYSENDAHRADVDSEFLLEVWKVMVDIIKQNKVDNLNQINESFQNEKLFERNRGSWISIYCLKNEYIRDLYKLISISLTDNFFGSPKIFKNILDQYRSKFLISNSPTEGEILEKAISLDDESLEKVIEFYDFITICPITCFLHEIDRKIYSQKLLEDATKRIIKISKKLNKKVVVSSDTYYLNKLDKSIFDVYVHVKSIGGKRHRFYKYDGLNNVMPDLYYRSTDEMFNEFEFINDYKILNEIIVDNPNEIASLFDYDIIPIKNQLCSPSIEGAEEKLISKIWTNAKTHYGDNIDQHILDRINHEIDSVVNNGFSMIYWFSHLLVKKSIDDGYIVGSRGSVGSSITAYLVNITDVNPLPPHYLCSKCKYIKFMNEYESGYDLPTQNCPYCNIPLIGDGHNIPFETFMGFKGDKIPDIDLNFSALYQAKAHEFIREMFGKEKVLRAGTISTVAEKTAFGYVKAYFEEINKPNVKTAEIIRIASRCEDVKRTTGQHPGGIIVIPNEYDVYDFTPINFPADDKTLDWHTTHFAFEYLHDTLLKFDILGHDNPTVLKMLSEKTGVNVFDIPSYDKDVMELFSSTKSLKIKFANIDEMIKVGTNGIPEFGTNFVKEMLVITRPQKFSDLIRISGLSHGTNVWTGNAKDLIENQGINISNVISCRDDIMVFLLKKGIEPIVAFKIMEDVRKGKGLKEEYIQILEDKKIDKWYIESCQKIEYLFPKAHATAYVIMAWKIAWFKIYYPLHFYSSYLSIRSEVFDISTIIHGKNSILEKINEIKSKLNDPKTKNLVKNKEKELIPIYEICLEMIARGYSIRNIDLEKSLENEFIVENDYLIPPFSTIDGLGDSVAKSIVDARNKKPFASKEDLLERTKITKTHFKILNDLGVLSNLNEDSQLTFFG